MKSLDELYQIFSIIESSSNPDKINLFNNFSDKVDAFAMMIIYRNPRQFALDKKHDYAMLAHNGCGAWIVARNFSKFSIKGKFAKHTDTGIPYTECETNEVIDRNLKVAVENYKSILEMFTELVQHALDNPIKEYTNERT